MEYLIELHQLTDTKSDFLIKDSLDDYSNCFLTQSFSP